MSIKIIKDHKGMPLFVHGRGPAALNIKSKQAENPAPHVGANPDTEEEAGKNWHIPWGSADNFPREMGKLMRRTTVGRAGLQRLTKYLYGQRLITFKVEDITDGGKEVIKLVKDPSWAAIRSRNNFNMVRLGMKQDYTWYSIAFAEIIFTGDKSEVYSINYHKASHCRFAPIDPKTGRIPYVYISGNFPNVREEDCQKLPVIDMINFADQIQEIRSNTKDFKYIMPLFWPDVIMDYYPVAFWDSARESGWLDIAISIPAYKKALFKNQMSLKYDIQIPIEYFEMKYKNWNKMADDDRDIIIQELYDSVTASLTGAANAQKALMSFYTSDSRSGKPMGKWEIKVIDDKMKNDAYLPDTTAADFQISYSMGLNPAQSGQGSGGSSSAGGGNNGGSNIRESGLDLRAQLKADRDVCLSFFEFIKAYNNLDPELELGVQDMVLTTLDQGRGTEKVVS